MNRAKKISSRIVEQMDNQVGFDLEGILLENPDDEVLMEIVDRYLSQVDPDAEMTIFDAVNLMSKDTVEELMREVKTHLDNRLKDQDLKDPTSNPTDDD